MNDEKNSVNMKLSAVMKSQTPSSPGKRLEMSVSPRFSPRGTGQASCIVRADTPRSRRRLDPRGSKWRCGSSRLLGFELETRDRRERVGRLTDDPEEPRKEPNP